jgi:hypothetical protein
MATRYSIEEVEETSEELKKELPKHHHKDKKEEVIEDHDLDTQANSEVPSQDEEKLEDSDIKINPEDSHSVPHSNSHDSQEKQEQFWSPQEEKEGFEHEGKTENLSTPPDSGSNKSWVWIALIVFGVLLVAGGAFWYLQVRNQQNEEISATPLEASTPLPTPTPQAAVTEKPDYATYEAQVLNGSGIPGEAGKVQTILEGLGFTEIETGNAKAFTHKMTLIQAKKDTPNVVVDGLKEELSKSYEVEVGTNLEENYKFDVLITVGSTKAE